MVSDVDSYRELPPPPDLAAYVECFWTKDVRIPNGAGPAQRVLPDGCVDLLFHLETGKSEVVGTMTQAFVVPPVIGRALYFAARLRPGAASAILRASVHEVTDQHVPLGSCWHDAGALFDVLSASGSARRRVELLSNRLRRAVAREAPPDLRVAHAIGRLSTRHAPNIHALQRELGLTRQHLARLFKQHVGIAPKLFHRVMRLQRVVRRLGSGSAVDGATLALDHGFNDQAHLLRDFRLLAGVTPSEWMFHFSKNDDRPSAKLRASHFQEVPDEPAHTEPDR